MDEDHNIEKATDSGSSLTLPKPDIYLCFPMNNSSNKEPRGFRRDVFVQNFRINTLGMLLNQGLVCGPTTGVRKCLDRKGHQTVDNWGRAILNRAESDGNYIIDAGVEDEQPLLKDHLLSFPWAVVELKHTNVTPAEVTKCYCQRANAASRALRIFENLSRSSDIVDGEQVPPVIVLTFIDSKFKLWIAFSTLDSNSTP